MIIVMQPDAGAEQIEAVEAKIRAHGLEVHVSRGTERTLIGAVGDERALEPEMFDPMPGVEKSMHIVKQYKMVAREWHKANTVIDVSGIPIGGNTVQVIAGPCSVETIPQMTAAAAGVEGRRCTTDARRRLQASDEPLRVSGQGSRRTGDAAHVGRRARASDRHRAHGRAHARCVSSVRRRCDPDRHAQHAEFRPAEGGGQDQEARHPQAQACRATINEWLMAAEYIAAGGNHDIIFCERGIRTFETAYRNVLDVTAIPVLKRETHLPVIVDPSHAGGKAWMVPALSSAAVAAGADGLLIEVHPNPCEALCDADQALTPAEFATLMGQLGAIARAIGRDI